MSSTDRSVSDFWPPVLSRLLAGEDLSTDEAAGAMSRIMSGEATPVQVTAFVVALRAKGETPGEVAGLARTMLALAPLVEAPGPVVDTCGTGGDRAGTINVSTIAAIVAAGAGAVVAKHGNRAASSRCGSADLLEALGVQVALQPDDVARCLRECGSTPPDSPRFKFTQKGWAGSSSGHQRRCQFQRYSCLHSYRIQS